MTESRSALTEEIEGQMIDMSTGEVVDTAESLREADITVEDLPQVARVLRALQRRMDMIHEYEEREIERIHAICNGKATGVKEQFEFFKQKARLLMESCEAKRKEYPGLGSFSFRTGVEKVVDELYVAMGADVKSGLHAAHEDMFRTKTTVAPDKKAIKEAIKSGKEVPGFFVVKSEPTFNFKPEN